MKFHFFLPRVVLSMLVSAAGFTAIEAICMNSEDEIIFCDQFEENLDNWVIEQQPGGRVYLDSGRLIIEDQGGCSVWLKQKLKAPVSIRYKVKASSAARVSDINCFWMASEPGHEEDHFYAARKRDGSFASYDILKTYYVGMGGNYNSTTRFRRYEGGGKRPLLPEHDLSDPRFMIVPDHEYEIQLVAADGFAKYYVDGELIFEYRDDEPLTEGWFAFRTVLSHLEIRDLIITTPGSK